MDILSWSILVVVAILILLAVKHFFLDKDEKPIERELMPQLEFNHFYENDDIAFCIQKDKDTYTYIIYSSNVFHTAVLNDMTPISEYNTSIKIVKNLLTTTKITEVDRSRELTTLYLESLSNSE